MRALLTASLLFLGSASAADPASEGVAKLIDQLGSPDFRAREAASKELDALGGPALPALQKAAAASGDAEAARRAAELAAKIARRLDNDRAIAPTLVELNFEDAPLATVLAELQKQSGGKLAFDDASAPGAKVTVKTGGKVPYWDAVVKVCAAAGLEVVPAAAPAQTVSAARSREARILAEQQAMLADVMAKQQAALQQLRAAQATAAKNGARVDEKKAEALAAEQKRQRERLELVLVQLAQMQAQQAVIERTSRYTPSVSPPANPGVVALRPRSETPNPSCVSGAVRVEAVPFPAAVLATVPRDTVPVVLHASPEPRLKWERVEAVRVTRATDDAGRELAAAAGDDSLPTRVVPVQGGAVVLDARGGVNLVSGREPNRAPGFLPSATQALVRLKASAAPRSLKSLEGVVRGVIRTGPEELVSVAGLNKKPVASALGVNGVVLAITVTERAEGEAFDVEATLRYNPAEVQVAGQPDYEEMVQGRGGRAVIVRAQMVPGVAGGGAAVRGVPGGGFNPGGGVGPRPSSAFGLTLTDAEGKPFTLAVASSRRRHDRTGGEVTDSVKLIARPSEDGMGSPAKATFTGTRAKVVEIPFKLADVPVAAGTAEAPDELKKPAGR
jgi:hypothetical protein